MGVFEVEVPADNWVTFDESIDGTIAMQSICLLFSCILFGIRCYQTIKEEVTSDKNKKTRIRLLQISHLLAMFMSCLYIFLWLWNYAHLYSSTNSFDCSDWFYIIMVTLTLSKIFVYSFLMLRSSLAFDILIFSIPLVITITVIVLSGIAQTTMAILMVTDFTPIQPFGNGFCFRILGETGEAGISGFNVVDALSGLTALFIFWIKSRSVKESFKALEDKQKVTGQLRDVNDVFRKHVLLGTLIFAGSVLIFFAGEFLSSLMGIASALHQSCNNFYIFLLFKQNAKIYNILCCRKGEITFNADAKILTLQNVKTDTGDRSMPASNLKIPNNVSTDSKVSVEICMETPVNYSTNGTPVNRRSTESNQYESEITIPVHIPEPSNQSTKSNNSVFAVIH